MINDLSRFIVLPSRGLLATVESASNSQRRFLNDVGAVKSVTAARSFAKDLGIDMGEGAFRVIDSMFDEGAKLIEMTAEVANKMKANEPGLRIVPLLKYKPAMSVAEIARKVKASVAGVGIAVKTVVTVLSKVDGKPLREARVVAFTDYGEAEGAEGITNSKGEVKLSLGSAEKIERLYVYGPVGFWGYFAKNLPREAVSVSIEPVNLGVDDCLRTMYKPLNPNDGKGITVGVVDTGIGPHSDLKVDGGANTVKGESSFADNGLGHGTHVAGIIAARGAAPTGMGGIAPAVTLRSYRVFPKGEGEADNFAISQAIGKAVADGCDLINLSLVVGEIDPALTSAVYHARQHGTLVFAANGNDGRKSVSYPASDGLCIAVSALGVKGTYPAKSSEDGDVLKPFGTNPAEFVAAFSNIGGETDLAGPGVGVISTLPGGYGPMSGTSMACPAVTGFAARLLALHPELTSMPRDNNRSDAMARAVMLAASRRGFESKYVGNGVPA